MREDKKLSKAIATKKVLIAFAILLKCNKGVFFISGKNGRYMLKFILDFYIKKDIRTCVRQNKMIYYE